MYRIVPGVVEMSNTETSGNITLALMNSVIILFLECGLI